MSKKDEHIQQLYTAIVCTVTCRSCLKVSGYNETDHQTSVLLHDDGWRPDHNGDVYCPDCVKNKKHKIPNT